MRWVLNSFSVRVSTRVAPCASRVCASRAVMRFTPGRLVGVNSPSSATRRYSTASGRTETSGRPLAEDDVLNHWASLLRASAGRSFLTTMENPPGTGCDVASTRAMPGCAADHSAQSSSRTTVASAVPRVRAVRPAWGNFSYCTARRSWNDSPASFSMPRAM